MPERARFLARARELFAAVYGDLDGPLCLLIRDGAGRCVRVEVPPEMNGNGLAPIESSILETLRTANAAVPPKALARRSGYTYNSHFRGIMAGLVRRGLAVRSPDGFCLPGSI